VHRAVRGDHRLHEHARLLDRLGLRAGYHLPLRPQESRRSWPRRLWGVLVFSIALGPLVLERMAKLEVSRSERSLLERVKYYTVAWYIFRDYPLRGLGWGRSTRRQTCC